MVRDCQSFRLPVDIYKKLCDGFCAQLDGA